MGDSGKEITHSMSTATPVGRVVTADSAGSTTEPAFVARLRSATPWWVLPVTVVVVLTAFSVYAAFTALQGFGLHPAYTGEAHGAPLLSPFYSPRVLVGRTPISPALWIIWSPLAFRATCYYYRKAYYRSFFWDPPGCAINERRHRTYRGEAKLPLVLNNLHRFFLYVALIVLAWLWVDAVQAFSYNGHPYLGLGTAIMLLNVVLLSGYTFSCHSLRHLVGGRIDCFSCVRFGKARHSAFRFLTSINGRHPTWAWVSLFSVLSVDIYVRIVNAGFGDPHIPF
ncbi:MAG: succinate dehydrogenase [Candidatus Dormibacteria bacterium]